MKKKVLGIVICVVVVTAAVVLGLFAAGVIGRKNDAVAKAASASITEGGFFGNLGKDAYFDVREERDPSTAIDNYVRVTDSKGNRVPMKSTRLENGLYRLSARDGFVERATYRIRLYFGEFVKAEYAPYDTFVFTIAGKGETETVDVKDGIEKVAIEGTVVEPILVGTEYYYNLILAEAAETRYQEGQLILAKKPDQCFLGEEFQAIYNESSANQYSGLAAYYVLRESEVVDGREEVYCRLAKMNEVFDKVDIYKSVPITKDNLKIDEEALAEQFANSQFAEVLLQAAEATMDLYSAEFPIRTQKPKIVVSVFADAIFPDSVDTSGLENALPDVEAIMNDFVSVISKNMNVDEFMAALPDINVEEFFSNLPNSVNVDAFISDLSKNLSVDSFLANLPNINVDEYFAKLPIQSVKDFISKLSNLSVDDFKSILPNINVSEYLKNLPKASVDQIAADLMKSVNVENFISDLTKNLSVENLTSNLPSINVQEFFSNLPANVDLKDFIPDLPSNVSVESYIANLPKINVQEYFANLSSGRLNEIVSNLSNNLNVDNYLSGLTKNINVDSFLSSLPSINAKDFLSNIPTPSLESYLAKVSPNVSVDSFLADLPSMNVQEYLSGLPKPDVESLLSGLTKNLSVENFVSGLTSNLNPQELLSKLPTDINVQDFFANLPKDFDPKDLIGELPKGVDLQSYVASLPKVNVKEYFTSLSQTNVQGIVENLKKSINLDSYLSNLPTNFNAQSLLANLPSGINAETLLSYLPNVSVEGLISDLSKNLNVDQFKALLPDVNVEDFLSELSNVNVQDFISNLSKNLSVEDFINCLPKDVSVEKYFSNLPKLSVEDFISKLPNADALKADLAATVDKYKTGTNDGSVGYNAELILNVKFTITLAKGLDVVFSVNNRVKIDPYLNFQYSYDLSAFSFDYELNFGANINTQTVCSIDMAVPEGKMEATSVEDFKEKFTALVKDQTTEKALCANEVKIWNMQYWIYCFCLELEIGFDFDFELKAQMNFEYHYNTQMSAGVSFVEGEFTTYKSFDSQQEAKDFVLFGKATLKAGLYLKFMGTLLSVAGVGFKIKLGAYGEVGGQFRIDMEAALKKKQLHIMKGYYIEAGLYFALDFSVKAGVDIPVYGFLGYKNNFELAEIRYPIFQKGSKFLIKSFVNEENNVEIQGASAKFDNVLVNAFDLDKIADANKISVPIDSFDIDYIGGAEKYVTLRDGGVYVSPSVGTEFTARVKLTAKSDSYVVGYVNFHKAAVMPTCEITEAKFDKKTAADVTFDTLLNKSEFVALQGENISPAYYTVNAVGGLTISKNFLNTLPMGAHKFSYVTSRGNIILTVNVVDSTPISAEKTSATFNKSAKANVPFKLNLHGNAIKSVSGLQKGEYTVDKSGTFVIYALGLMKKDAGSFEYVVTATNDTSVALTVTVKDDRDPILYETAFSFAKVASLRNPVPVKFEKYGYEVKSVEGSGIAAGDYTVTDNCVSIGANFLAGLSAGSHAFSIRFRADKEVVKSFTVSVKDNAKIVAYTSYAEFDKNAPSDVEFTVVAAGSIVLTGNNIAAGNYSYSGNTLKIRRAFLENLAEGEYQFSASSSSESERLTVKVINTAAPEIVSEDVQADGTLTLSFDKAKPKALSFELFLTDRNAFSVSGLKYTLTKNDKGTFTFTVAAETLSALSNGEHEFELLTGVNSLFLTVKVTNSAKPTPTSQTSLSYILGSMKQLSYNFTNAKAKINNIEVRGEGVTSETNAIYIEKYSYIVDVDGTTGTFTIDPNYCEFLPAGYYKVLITFADEDGSGEFVTNVGITVSQPAQ
ncbi:MAG: hypothetical protein K5753_02840 [Clostridia bacterium]|nr:hypothetical protein [Clostridia bacterium]